MAKAFVAAVSAALGEEFTFTASGPRFVWHSAATNIRILECHVAREQERWVGVAMGGLVEAKAWRP